MSTLVGYFLVGFDTEKNRRMLNDIRNTPAYKEALKNVTSVRQCISIFSHMFSDRKENLGRYLVWISLSLDIFSKLISRPEKDHGFGAVCPVISDDRRRTDNNNHVGFRRSWDLCHSQYL